MSRVLVAIIMVLACGCGEEKPRFVDSQKRGEEEVEQLAKLKQQGGATTDQGLLDAINNKTNLTSISDISDVVSNTNSNCVIDAPLTARARSRLISTPP